MSEYKCAFCKDENFSRLNPDISDWCLVLKNVHLPPLGAISIDVFILPLLEHDLHFCGVGCLKNWCNKND
jgi:hypothetical protein